MARTGVNRSSQKKVGGTFTGQCLDIWIENTMKLVCPWGNQRTLWYYSEQIWIKCLPLVSLPKVNISFSLANWKFKEVHPKNSKIEFADRLTSMPVNLRLSPDRLTVTPLFDSDPPSEGTSNWTKSFSYWFPAKSFTVFAFDGNDPQVCSRSQPARIGFVSVFYGFS